MNKVIVLGVGKMPADCLRVLCKEGVAIEKVVETALTPFSSLKGTCRSFSVPYVPFISKENVAKELNAINGSASLLSINNPYLFSEDFLSRKEWHIVNFHGSLLPAYRGNGDVIPAWVIYNKETTHGVTWHKVNPLLDAGDIIVQEAFPVSYSDTALTVMMNVIKTGIVLFSRYWRSLLDHDFPGRVQRGDLAPVYRKRDLPNEGMLNVSWDFETMGRFLRCMDSGAVHFIPPARLGQGRFVKRYRIIRREDILETKVSTGKDFQQGYHFDFPEGEIDVETVLEGNEVDSRVAIR